MKYAMTVQVRLGGFRPAPLVITATECRWTAYTPYIGIGKLEEVTVEPAIEVLGAARSHNGKRSEVQPTKRRIQLPAPPAWLGIEAAGADHNTQERVLRDRRMLWH